MAEAPTGDPPTPVQVSTPLPPPSEVAGLLRHARRQSPFDPVDVLINRSNLVYIEGEHQLRLGFLERAHRKFDDSLELIFRSEFTIHESARLLQHYERLLDGIHGHELATLKAGDGFSEVPTEPAPLDELLSLELPLTFDPRSRQLAEDTVRLLPHDIPLPLNNHVLRLVEYYQKRGRRTMERGMEKAGRYRRMISRILAEEGVPQDLIYLCQTESAFRPRAYSRARCKGLWQFHSRTAATYDLRQDWWIDERSDPERSTRAAARHLRDLYGQFGDWLLAMAAYNFGAGGVERAIARTGSRDFWQLRRRGRLPRETRNYVPMILATTIISKDPGTYGFAVKPDQPLEVDKVRLDSAIDLRLVAEVLEISLAEVEDLNPHVRRMTTPPNDAAFTLYVPADRGEKFLKEIETIPEDVRVSWRKHRVKEGETLSGIAEVYRTTAQAISQVNGLGDSQVLAMGSKLIIPVTLSRDPTAPLSIKGRRIRYVIQEGDTITSVASNFDVSRRQLRRWNRLRRRSRLRPGRRLTIYVPQHLLASAPKARPQARTVVKAPEGQPLRVIHRVKKGDTLYKIATNYNTTVNSICKWNNLSRRAYLRIGKKLTIYTDR